MDGLTDRHLVVFYMPMLAREADVLSTGDHFYIEFVPGYAAEPTSDDESPAREDQDHQDDD